MKEELESELQEEFPFMKQSNDQKDNCPYRIYGCECSSGWYDLIRECCRKIADKYAGSGTPVDFVPEQIKEKFGTLRFYYSFEDAPLLIQALDMIGGPSIRFEPGSKDDDEIKKQFRHEIAEIVREAEKKSACTCEFCGAAGELRRDLGWIRTLCDSCYEKVRNKRTEE